MYYIDTHSHIYMNNFDKDREEVINRAIDNNVKKIICIAVDLKSTESCLKIAEKYPEVFATTGIHPHEAKNVPNQYLQELEMFSKHKSIVGIGEIGLDYHYNFSDQKQQILIYNEQLELAKSLNMPTIVHSRKAEKDILNGILLSNNNYGVIHCFSGTLDFLKEIINTGYLVSFTGLITFEKSLELVIKEVPLNKIMLETDSPYLTPIPNRGKRNEPLFVKDVAQKIADIKDITIKQVVTKTTNNAESFFKKMI